MIEFDGRASVHDQHPVAVHYRVQTVGYGQHGARPELLPNRALNRRVGPTREQRGVLESTTGVVAAKPFAPRGTSAC